jgi:hypothetical protein
MYSLCCINKPRQVDKILMIYGNDKSLGNGLWKGDGK